MKRKTSFNQLLKTGSALLPPMQLKHRLAEIEDLDAVYALYMDESANPFLTYDPMSRSEFSPIYDSMLKDNNVFVVELNNEVIGTYRLIRKTNRQAHILYLGGFTIKNSFKGKGIGFEVLTHIKQMAAEQVFKRIELTV